MPRGTRRAATRGRQHGVPRGRRLENLQENVRKMVVKEERKYTENNVVFVHRAKKRARLSSEEREQVCMHCIVSLFLNNVSLLCRKKARLQKQKEVAERQSFRESLRWETFFLVQNGGNPDGNSPIKAGLNHLRLNPPAIKPSPSHLHSCYNLVPRPH